MPGMSPAQPAARPAQPSQPEAGHQRLYYLDAFRGFTMVCMISTGFGLQFFSSDPFWGPLARQFEHEPWEGMRFWDLIQPFFMFIVGAAMPIAFARRWAAGETYPASLRRVVRRCVLLLFWGLVARSIQAGEPTLDLINVLAQLSFTYFAAFLLLRKSWRAQAAAAFGLLAAHWALYQFAPLAGLPGPWTRDANFGSWLDQALLGKNWNGSYATINCLSSAANTIFGVMAGTMLISQTPPARKMQILLRTGFGAVLLGLALSPAVPIIKRIWTPSFAIFSTGFTLLALLLFYWLTEVLNLRRWAKVFVVVGANSIFIYLFHEILGRWLTETGLVFLRVAVEAWGPWGQALNAWAVIAAQIWLCWWLWRKRIFFKL